ncbi:hypothetical protein [Flagellimonas sp.]|uniref:hypothetical protein n=1 Tax=Flagellimonas sp. TaxID=2058762 RepID=UPI003AB15792
MRFLGRVAAVFVANLITLAFIAIAFAMLISDQGQSFMRHLGYDISPLVSAYHQSRIQEWKDPRVGRITPTEITPKINQSAPAKSKPTLKAVNQTPDRHAVQTSLNTCRFWNDEYRKDGSDRSRGFRDAACNRYESLSGNDIGSVLALAKAPQRKTTSQQISSNRTPQKSRNDRQHEANCERLKEKIEYYDAKLRSGGDGNYMKYWRGERRKVSNKYAWECLRG